MNPGPTILFLDGEQTVIMLDAAEAANAFLRYRAGRRDPDGHISNSCDLQTIKIEQVKRQIGVPLLPPLDQCDPVKVAALQEVAALFAGQEVPAVQQQILGNLVAAIFALRDQWAMEHVRPVDVGPEDTSETP